MCGLVGVVSTEGQKNQKDRGNFFRSALIADAVLGSSRLISLPLSEVNER